MLVDSGIMTFVNHGCNKTYNSGVESSIDEFTADVNVLPDSLNCRVHAQTSTFNPVLDRHLWHTAEHTLRDIKAGEEILDNHLAFVGDEKYWASFVQHLRDLCSGNTNGIMTK
jgi:hypothetical protein